MTSMYNDPILSSGDARAALILALEALVRSKNTRSMGNEWLETDVKIGLKCTVVQLRGP